MVKSYLVIYEENGMDVFEGTKKECEIYVNENNDGDEDRFGIYPE